MERPAVRWIRSRMLPVFSLKNGEEQNRDYLRGLTMKKVLDGFSKVVEVLLVIMMVAMMAVVFLATVGRYSQLYTIAWSEEFARYCMVGIVYLGLMLASRTDSHFVVEIIPLIFAKKPKIVKIFGLINAIIVDAFAIFLGSQGWKVCTKMLVQGKQSPMMRIPLGAVYMIIPVGIILMAVFYTISAVSKFRDNTEEKEENESWAWLVFYLVYCFLVCSLVFRSQSPLELLLL